MYLNLIAFALAGAVHLQPHLVWCLGVLVFRFHVLSESCADAHLIWCFSDGGSRYKTGVTRT